MISLSDKCSRGAKIIYLLDTYEQANSWKGFQILLSVAKRNETNKVFMVI